MFLNGYKVGLKAVVAVSIRYTCLITDVDATGAPSTDVPQWQTTVQVTPPLPMHRVCEYAFSSIKCYSKLDIVLFRNKIIFFSYHFLN